MKETIIKKRSRQKEFSPKIVSFVCNWSAWLLLKGDGFRPPPNIHFIRVMCLGRITPSFVFNAFELGADGVLLLGCPPGECHYSFGNKIAEEHLDTARKVTYLLGIEKERLGFISASIKENKKFVRGVNKFIEGVKKIGPSPLKDKYKGE